MSKLFNLFLFIALLAIGFSSCSDDDDDDNIFINSAETLPTNIAFEDINLKGGEISGDLTWTKPVNTSELSAIVIYTSNDGTNKETKLKEIPVNDEKYTLTGINYAKYLLLVPKNKNNVEGNTFAKIELKDEVGNNVVTDLSFDDTDYAKGKIGGKLTWTKPTGIVNLSKYIIYTSEDGTTKKDKIAEVDTDIEEYIVESRSMTEFFIVVATDLENKEVEDFAKTEVKDAYEVSGIYILNSGKQGHNNANMSFYDLTAKTLSTKVFEAANGISLGDTGQDIIVYGTKMYIAVYGSGVIFVTDKQGKQLGKIESVKNGKAQQPRGFTTHDGKVYVTYFDGNLAKIDTTKMEIEAQVPVGRNPEYVRVANNNLYVANSGGLDYNNPIGYDKFVSVVDIATFKETTKIPVVINPDKMAVDSEGDIYVISNGDYKTIPNTLQRIDAKTHKVTNVGNATWMNINNDKLYIIYSQYDANWNQVITYSVYDTKTEKIITDKFITDGTVVNKPFSITTDPVNNYVYIGTSDYTNNGDMYIFSAEGKLINKFDTGGISPAGAYYASWIVK
ncbi:YncE family protein [Prevotella sp. 10(H)]|uniref:YncE family protein n=1 Tax=Prevotella sp. 10(H) TaxID=1158294 RepID=UPI0012DE930B|nr:DUF5074 domain-containing protein [Prevotella sp. 10(H)]